MLKLKPINVVNVEEIIKMNQVKTKFTSTQWTVLLFMYVVCYVGYIIVDITSDGIFDMNGHVFFIFLIILATIATIWYKLARTAHNFTR
jgi:CDP-diglyceride synthetase